MRASARRSPPWFAAAFCAVALSLGAIDAWADHPATLRATAGLGGLVKAGRWAPVQVDVEHHGAGTTADLAADLVVHWGDATVRRRVRLGSPATRRYELYLRTTDPTSVVRVSLEGHADAVEVPVTVLPQDSAVTLCVSGALTADADGQCSITLAPRQLPGSVRGYEVVDAVVAGPSTANAGPAATALAAWRALSVLDTSSDLSLTPQVSRPRVRRGIGASLAAPIALGSALYVVLLVAAGTAAAAMRLNLSRAGLTFGLCLLAASGLALAVGRVGPGSHITVHHTSLVQQIPGTDASLLTMRGIADYPTNEHAELRVPIEDAMIEASTAAGRNEQRVDDHGNPVLALQVGLGNRRSFAVEGVGTERWLEVKEHGRTIQVTNRTPHSFRDCRFAEGMSVQQPGELLPGASATAVREGEVSGPLFTCITSAPALVLSSAQRAVAMTGTTTIAVYLRRSELAAAVEAPND